MAWAKFFYSTNIAIAVAQSASFKKAVKMMSRMKRSYLPPSYHNMHKRLLSDTKNKIYIQIAKRAMMFIQTHGVTLAGDGWSSINNHFFLNKCDSLASEEFPWAIDTLGHMKDAFTLQM